MITHTKQLANRSSSGQPLSTAESRVATLGDITQEDRMSTDVHAAEAKSFDDSASIPGNASQAESISVSSSDVANTELSPRKLSRNQSARTMANFWLDALMLFVLVGTLWTATVVRFVFPPSVNAKEWLLWGWTVDQWIGLSYGFLSVFTFLIVVHLMLHWTWVCGVIAARWLPRVDGKKTTVDDGIRTLWGVGLLIALLGAMGFGLGVAVLTIQGP